MSSEPEGKPRRPRITQKRSEETQEMANDESLNAEFDKLSKYAEAPSTPKPMRAEKRRRGRPKAGRIVFHQRRIDLLPQFGYLSDVARRLGIKHATLQQWCVLEKHPLPFIQKGDHKVFRKDVLVAWLAATKRFNIKPEYSKEQ